MLSPAAGKKQRPYRLACLQLSTYDGLFLNARELLRRIGSLCDYILFDAAWAGYENFLRSFRILPSSPSPWRKTIPASL